MILNLADGYIIKPKKYSKIIYNSKIISGKQKNNVIISLLNIVQAKGDGNNHGI